MAKQSMKQEVLQSIVNSQLQQAMRANQQEESNKIRADFDNWQKQQMEPANIQADFNNWLQSQNAQAAQIPSLANTQPKRDLQAEAREYFAKVRKERAEEPEKTRKFRASMEDYQRQQQEEQMLAEKKKQKVENPFRSDYLAIKTQQDLGKDKKATSVDNWLDPNYKLSDQDKAAARQYAQAELAKYDYNSSRQPVLKSTEDRQHYADMVNLLNKTNGLTNAMTGVIKQPLNLARTVRDVGKDVKDQLTGLGAALTDKFGITDDATKRHEVETAIRDQMYKQNDESMQRAYKGAKTQNPAATTVGEIGGQMGMYMLTNPLFDSLGAAAGLGKAGSFVLNQVGQNAQDLALDTIPTLNQYLADGTVSDEEKRAILANVGINAAGNLAFGAAGAGWDALKQNRAATKAANEAFRANVNEGAERLARLNAEGYIPPQKLQADEIASLNMNPVEANNKQFSELMNTFNSQFKDESAMRNIFSPEDLEAAQDNQFRQLMEENLIPERLNPEVEMEGLEDAYREIDELKALQDELPTWEEEPKLSKDEIDHLLMGMEPAEAAETVAKEPPITQEISDRLMYDFDDINNRYFGNYEAIRRSLDNKDFSVPNAAINTTVDKNGKTVYQVVDAQTQRPIRTYTTQKAAEKAKAEFIAGDVPKAKAIKAFEDMNEAIGNYEKAAFNATDVEEVNTAKKALEATRKRYERAMKDVDPSYYDDVSGKDFADSITKPYYTRNPQAENPVDEELLDEITQDWADQDFNNPNRFVRDAEPDTGASYSTPGANPLQTFAEGENKEQWKTGKWRTNTAEKTGKIKNPDDAPLKNYAYRVFTEEEQNIAAAERYADVDDIAKELLNKDYDGFDEVDVKAAQNEWNKLMDAGDAQSIKKADRLGRRIAYEVREGGRIPQALAEFSRNTPEGQVRFVQRSLDDLTDKTTSPGTSEALGDIANKIDELFDKHGNDKEALKRELSDLFDGNMKNHVSSKTAEKMNSKSIKGKKSILKMIDDGADAADIIDVVYKQNGGVKLSAQENKQIYDLLKQAKDLPEGSYEQEELLARAAKIATSRAPSTFGQKVRGVLYANMLGNFKTAISRNFFGNMAYQTLEQGRQPISAAVDKAVSKITKKHSALGINKGKMKAYAEGFKQGGADQLRDMKLHIDTGRSGSKGWENALKNNRSTFNGSDPASKLMNNVEYYVGNALELGDRPWFEANYKQASTELHQLVDRYGKNNVAGLEGISDANLDDVIDMIANVRAADAVFQKQGKMSKGLSDLRNGLGGLSEGAIGVDVLSTSSSPFTLTPGNMLERAVEYTPLGAVKNAVETVREVAGKKGFNQRRFVDEASRTIAGLPILGGAYALARSNDPEGEKGEWVNKYLGSINGGYSTDPDEKQAQIDDGFIEYGYNVPGWMPGYGGKTLDTSDLPVIGPFMQAGAVMSQEGISPKSSLQAAEAVLGGSATQGIRRAFGADNAGYSSQDTIVNNLINTVKSSGTQLVPSLLRQTAQTIDPYKRDLGEYGTNDYYLNSIKNAIPGLRQTMPIKTDIEGNEVLQNQGRGLGSKILENYLLPMNVGEYNPSKLNQEATRLLDATDLNTAFVPKASRSDLRKWDEKAEKEYTEEQFRNYKKELGTLNSELGHAIIDSDFYKNLDDAKKAKTLGEVYSGMKAVAKYNATGLETDNKIANAYMNNEDGVQGVIDYLTGKSLVADTGLSSQTNAAKAIQAKAESGDTEAATDMTQQIELLPNYGLDLPGPNATYTKAYDVYGGLTAEDFARTYKGIDTDHNQALKKDEVVNYMNKQGFDYQEGMKFWKAYAKTEGKSPWKIPELQKNGTWK